MKRVGISPASVFVRGLAAALLLAGAGLVAMATTTSGETESTRPPTNLKFVDDHWTPWDPPTPPEGAEVYIIVKGDTLWDLAERDLEDPYLWPYIWDRNRYVLDSHWIYPGDPLMMPGPFTVVAEEIVPPDVEDEGEGGEEGDVGETAATSADLPVADVADAALMPPEDPAGRPRHGLWQKADPDAAADWSDMLCAGYILADPWKSDMYIYAAEEEHKYGFAPGDFVYLNMGLSGGVQPGDKFFVVHQEDKIDHPVTGRHVGRLVRKKAILQVIAAQSDTATAEIMEGCETVLVGYDLIRYTDLVSPKKQDTDLSRYGTEDNGQVTGHVIYGGLSRLAFGEGDIVYLDLGMDDGVEKGDYLMIYRDDVTGQKYNEYGFHNWKWRTKSRVPALNVRKIPGKMEIPRRMLGDLVILDINRHTATAKVMTSFREIYPGDEVQLLD